MTCTLNNTGRNGLYLYDQAPNIIRVVDSSSAGSGAILNIRIPALTPSSGMEITINGETVTSVIDNPGPRRWLVGPNEVATASNIADALNQCPSIVGACKVAWGTNGYVSIQAYGAGQEITYSTNIPLVEFEYVDAVPSQRADTLNVQVGGVTMTKKVCSDVTCFDISSVISSLAEFGKFNSFTAWVYARGADGAVTSVVTYNEWVGKGYILRGQEPFSSGVGIAQYLLAGDDREVYNRTMLYCSSDDDILISWRHNAEERVSLTVQGLDSALNVIANESQSVSLDSGINDLSINIANIMAEPGVRYISIILPDASVVRYDVIPSDSYEKRVRIYWRNSMAGISFADLTGEMTEKSDIESVYIRDEGSSYGYYTDEYRHDERLLYQDDDKTYTAQTHLIDKDGVWLYDDLARSLLAWIEEDGVKRMILVTGIEKVRSYDNVWRVKVTYKYSEL